MRFFEGLGVLLKTERGNRVFPVSDQAADIVDALSAYVRRGGCRVLHGEVRELLLQEGRLEGVRLASGEELHAPAVLVACGGLSYPATGSTGDGYRLARQAGHTVTELRPLARAARGAGARLRRDDRPFAAEHRPFRVGYAPEKGGLHRFRGTPVHAFRPFRPRDSQREQPTCGIWSPAAMKCASI